MLLYRNLLEAIQSVGQNLFDVHMTTWATHMPNFIQEVLQVW